MKKSLLLFSLLILSFNSIAQTFQQKLQTAVTDSWSVSGLPGVSVTVSTPDQGFVYAKGGIGNVYTNSAIVPATTKYRIASATKNFTAVLIMRLQEAGYFNINDKLSQHLTVAGLPNSNLITIKQMLEHTSGIGDYLNASDAFLSAAVADKVFTDAEIVGYINATADTFTPGSTHAYSNGGYYILGMLIEKKLGKTLDVAMQDWLFTPLGLSNTFVDLTSLTTNKIPDLAEGTRAYNYSPTSVKAAGAIVSTTEDMAKFEKAVFGGTYLTQASINSIILPSATNSAYGLGTRLYTSGAGIKYHGHTGTILGYNAFMYYIPAFDISVGISTNAYASPSSRWTDIRTAVYNVIEQEYLKTAPPVPTAPTAGQSSVTTPVNFAWTSNRTTSDYTLQVSKVNTSWNSSTGYTSSTTPTTTVVVNTVLTNLKTFSWSQGTAGSSEGPQSNATYYYTIKATNTTDGTTIYSTPIAFTTVTANCVLPTNTDIIVDNLNATVIGAWTTTTSTPGYVGTNYIHDGNALKGEKSVEFIPSLTQRGKYEAFIFYSAGTNRPANVPVDIYHEGGITTVAVNQQINSNSWISLGQFNMNSDGTSKVVIRTTGTSGVVIADAIKFSYKDCLLPVANYSPLTTTIKANETVTFTNSSKGAVSYNWTFQGGTPATSTAANPTVTYATTGNFDVNLTVTNDIGTHSKLTTAAIVVEQSLELQTNQIEDEIKIYPNPTSGTVQLTLPQDETSSLTLFQLNGQKLIEQSNQKESATIDLSQFENGIYILKIDTGLKTIIKKIILKK